MLYKLDFYALLSWLQSHDNVYNLSGFNFVNHFLWHILEVQLWSFTSSVTVEGNIKELVGI